MLFTSLLPHDAPDAVQRFARLVETAWVEGKLAKLLLSKPTGEAEATLERVTVREVLLRGERQLTWLWRHQTRDITKNHPFDESLRHLLGLLGTQFQNAHLLTDREDVQLAFSRKGKPSLRVGKLAGAETAKAEQSHDREKQRLLEIDSPFWTELALTHEVKGQRQLVPAMARKWKQINRFIEIFSNAFQNSQLAASPDVHVADFGSGKGYLTFAMHDWLSRQGKDARVVGVELRDDMVALCRGAADKHGLTGLVFDQGDVRSYTPARLDVMIALHACDIATDYAIHLGLRAGAQIIMCSPCCHKQLRPQMQMPAMLRPMLQHGIHLGQEAEMVTDSLRALLLESEGYDCQVFEFVALEHTSKNKMILAVKRAQPLPAARRQELLAQIEAIKAFYGIREQALQELLCAA
ncbi:SAM-dependent methyltransferase [Pelomonas sp. SE-A7]|uniref:class I SAM-dependent methyltransferase n=1 Tax=Pelomonas sp. SE-A7 TaxID=3054953 RepID=UPI00259C9465|nr:SAM-dependent methyltransferase [Pelomonas sp. SE-A7]MDM4766216.1 SAM-dependent methyltransferase [Pelomonas sp. SE-A7]